MAASARFLCAFAFVAVACVCFAVVEGRNVRRSVSLRQVDANASLAAETTQVAEAFQDSIRAVLSAANNSFSNFGNTMGAIGQNSSNILNILSSSTNQSLANTRTYLEQLAASNAKAQQALASGANKIFQASLSSIRTIFSLFG